MWLVLEQVYSGSESFWGYRVSEVDEWLGDGTPLGGRATSLGFFTVSAQSLSHLDVLVL